MHSYDRCLSSAEDPDECKNNIIKMAPQNYCFERTPHLWINLGKKRILIIFPKNLKSVKLTTNHLNPWNSATLIFF